MLHEVFTEFIFDIEFFSTVSMGHSGRVERKKKKTKENKSLFHDHFGLNPNSDTDTHIWSTKLKQIQIVALPLSVKVQLVFTSTCNNNLKHHINHILQIQLYCVNINFYGDIKLLQ